MNKKLLSIKTLFVAAGLCVGASASWAADYRTVWQQNFDGDDYASGWSNTPTQSLVSGTDYAIIFGTGSNSSSSSISFSGNTSFSQAKVYAFEFDYGVRATHNNGGENLITMNSNNGTSKLFTISTPKGSTTTTVFNAAGESVCTFANESYTNPASLPSYMYHFKVTVDEANGAKLTVTNSSSEKLLDDVYVGAYGQITGVSVAMGRYWATVAFNNLNLSYDLEQYTLRATNATATYSSISSSVMNSTVKSTLDAAYSTLITDYDTDDEIVANISGYATAISNLETAITNAQTSINNFIILNDLISNANTFATTVTEYSAPTDAESVYSSNADIDPLALATAVRNEIARASVAHGGGTDITAMIANSGFELGSMTGWSVTTKESDTDVQVVENSGAIYGTDGFGGTYFFNCYPNGNTLSQNIGTLKAGKYTLSANAASSGATLYLVVNGTPNTGNVTNAVANLTYTFTLASDAEVTIAISGGDNYTGEYLAEGGNWWYKCDDFSLTYVGQDELAQAKAGLTDEITAATTVKNNYSAKVGTAPFLYPIATYNTLVTELTEAQAVIDANGTEVDAYNDAKDELETAKEAMTAASQNTPDPDKYYRIFVANNDGTASDYNLNMLYETTMTQVKVTSMAYPVKFVASTGSYAGRYRIQTPYSNNLCTTKNALTNAYVSSADGVEERLVDISISLQDNGTVKMSSTNSGKSYYYAASASENANVTATTGNTGTWVVSDAVEVSNTSLSVNATAGWGTFIAPYDNLTPSTVKAYTVSYTENNVVYFTENETGVLSANTPYILSTEEADDVSKTFTGIANNDNDTYAVNGLVGLLTASEVPANSYVLQYNDGKVGFYKTTEAITGTANRCYLDLSSVPTEASSRATIFFDLFDSETAGIAQVEDGKQKMEDCLYNLNGQRISKPAKGLYIVNGKKVIIK